MRINEEEVNCLTPVALTAALVRPRMAQPEQRAGNVLGLFGTLDSPSLREISEKNDSSRSLCPA